jgi:hypothetical protein
MTSTSDATASRTSAARQPRPTMALLPRTSLRDTTMTGAPARRLTTVSPEPDALDLDTLAVEIRREHEAAEAAFESSVAHAMRCGQLLIEAKAKAGHGNWLPWVRANLPFSERTARNYMRLARNRQRIADLPSINEALTALIKARPTEPDPPFLVRDPDGGPDQEPVPSGDPPLAPWQFWTISGYVQMIDAVLELLRGVERGDYDLSEADAALARRRDLYEREVDRRGARW